MIFILAMSDTIDKNYKIHFESYWSSPNSLGENIPESISYSVSSPWAEPLFAYTHPSHA